MPVCFDSIDMNRECRCSPWQQSQMNHMCHKSRKLQASLQRVVRVVRGKPLSSCGKRPWAAPGLVIPREAAAYYFEAARDLGEYEACPNGHGWHPRPRDQAARVSLSPATTCMLTYLLALGEIDRLRILSHRYIKGWCSSICAAGYSVDFGSLGHIEGRS